MAVIFNTMLSFILMLTNKITHFFKTGPNFLVINVIIINNNNKNLHTQLLHL